MRRLWTLGFAVVGVAGLIGCVGGPGEPFSGGGTTGGSSSSDNGGTNPGTTSSSSSSSSSSGSTTVSTTVKASEFDQTCKVATDCTAIYQGDVCSPCSCPNAAVATTQLTGYQSKVSTARASCGEIPAIACGPCANVTTLCAGGKCNVAIGVAVDAGG